MDNLALFICYHIESKRIVCTFEFEDECSEFFNDLNVRFPQEYSWKAISYKILERKLSNYLD